MQPWLRILGPRPRERAGPRPVNNKSNPTVDPYGEDVPEEWRGYFLDKGEGWTVYRGPRPRALVRMEVGRAVFRTVTPLVEWKIYQERLDLLYSSEDGNHE